MQRAATLWSVHGARRATPAPEAARCRPTGAAGTRPRPTRSPERKNALRVVQKLKIEVFTDVFKLLPHVFLLTVKVLNQPFLI